MLFVLTEDGTDTTQLLVIIIVDFLQEASGHQNVKRRPLLSNPKRQWFKLMATNLVSDACLIMTRSLSS